MKSLATLIKLQKTRVDEQRLTLTRLQAHLENIENSIAALEIRKAREQDNVNVRMPPVLSQVHLDASD